MNKGNQVKSGVVL